VDNSRRCLQTVFQFRVGLELAVIFRNLFCNLGGAGAARSIRACGGHWRVFAHSGGGPAKHLTVFHFSGDMFRASHRAKIDKPTAGQNPAVGVNLEALSVCCPIFDCHFLFSHN
jgi:hypothetical protein